MRSASPSSEKFKPMRQGFHAYTPVLSRVHRVNNTQPIDLIILSKNFSTPTQIANLLKKKRVNGQEFYLYNGVSYLHWDGLSFANEKEPDRERKVCLYDFRSDLDLELTSGFEGTPIVPLSPYILDPADAHVQALRISAKAPYLRISMNDGSSYLAPLIYQELVNFDIDWMRITETTTTFGRLNSVSSTSLADSSFIGDYTAHQAEIFNVPSRNAAAAVFFRAVFYFALLLLLSKYPPNIGYLEHYLDVHYHEWLQAFKQYAEVFTDKLRSAGILKPKPEHIVLSTRTDLIKAAEHSEVMIWQSAKSAVREVLLHIKHFFIWLFTNI